MRCFFTTTLDKTEAIFRDGWTDLYQSDLHDAEGRRDDRKGVYFATQPLDANDGFDGDVALCLDIAEECFQQYEVTDTVMEQSGYRLAIIPAEVLNQLGKPQVYDHWYAGLSRRDLIRSADRWENSGNVHDYQHAQGMREAVAFFDRIGWLTPLKLREEGEQNP